MSVRSVVATAVGRMTRWVLHDVMRRGGSQLPGRVALSLDPRLVEHLRGKVREGSVVVCGTNGKTTTTNLVADALECAGKRVVCNRDGANMLQGVASALLPGRAADWAVIEADELSTIHILPQLKPRYLVLLNLFRDQLDRAGEIDHVQDVLVEALSASPGTTLLVCGDDPLSVAVARRAQARGTRVHAFGIAEDLHLAPDRVPEARFCQVCGAELHYAYRSYAQLGAFRCPSCSFARPQLAWEASDVAVSRAGIRFALSGPEVPQPHTLEAAFGGVYMVYNVMAAACAAHCTGVTPAQMQAALTAYHPHNGRLQHFVVQGRPVVLNLAKNPTGLNQNIALMLADERPKALFLVVNDHVNDGHDISWVWDVDVERLLGRTNLLRVIAGGTRAHDVQVRLKYGDIAAQLAGSVRTALDMVHDLPSDCVLYVLTNYSALQPAREELEAIGERS